MRNMLGFTGTYKGTRVSVLGTGMGVPSASIYATELVKFYDVKNLIRIGTSGGFRSDTKVRDIVMAIGACTDSNVNRRRFNGFDFAATADFRLLRTAAAAADEMGVPYRVGNIFTTDLFYQPDESIWDLLEEMGVLAVEMEAAGLYGLAAEHGGSALAIVTVSDHIRTGEELPPSERQTAVNTMIEVALETATTL